MPICRVSAYTHSGGRAQAFSRENPHDLYSRTESGDPGVRVQREKTHADNLSATEAEGSLRLRESLTVSVWRENSHTDDLVDALLERAGIVLAATAGIVLVAVVAGQLVARILLPLMS